MWPCLMCSTHTDRWWTSYDDLLWNIRVHVKRYRFDFRYMWDSSPSIVLTQRCVHPDNSRSVMIYGWQLEFKMTAFRINTPGVLHHPGQLSQLALCHMDPTDDFAIHVSVKRCVDHIYCGRHRQTHHVDLSLTICQIIHIYYPSNKNTRKSLVNNQTLLFDQQLLRSPLDYINISLSVVTFE